MSLAERGDVIGGEIPRIRVPRQLSQSVQSLLNCGLMFRSKAGGTGHLHVMGRSGKAAQSVMPAVLSLGGRGKSAHGLYVVRMTPEILRSGKMMLLK